MTPFEKAVDAASRAERFYLLPVAGGYKVISSADTGPVQSFDQNEELAAHDYAKRLTARAAIRAALPHLREPSEAMIKAGARSQETSWSVADDRWYAMFDAMLKEIGND